jgi:hypothetical protein
MRFKKGDRVLSMSAQALRNDHRFGVHQKYTLSTEAFTAHVCFPLFFTLKFGVGMVLSWGDW